MSEQSYVDNLIGTVLRCSSTDDWLTAKNEWEVAGCEEDESRSGTCICGKENLRYLYTIVNSNTGEVLYPIGSSCIRKFERDDMDEESACWKQAMKLVDAAVKFGKAELVSIGSGFYSRKLLAFMYEQDVFKPSKYNDWDDYNDYRFLLDMFNGGCRSEKQQRKCDAIIRNEVYPWLRMLWRKNKEATGA